MQYYIRTSNGGQRGPYESIEAAERSLLECLNNDLTSTILSVGRIGVVVEASKLYDSYPTGPERMKGKTGEDCMMRVAVKAYLSNMQTKTIDKWL